MVRAFNPLSYKKPRIEGLRHYSPTELEGILECPRRRFFQRKINKKLTWPDFAKGTHMHRKIEELRLHHLRKGMGKNLRYKSADAFANTISADWHRTAIKENRIEGKKILWDDEKQPYRIKKEIVEMGLRIYPILMEEQKTNLPIIFTHITKKGKIIYRTAYEFEFSYKGRGFTGEIDEIKKSLNFTTP